MHNPTGHGPHGQAHSDSRVEARLTELEIKASYAEDTIDRLNEVVVRQQTQIDALLREVADLRHAPAADTPARGLRDELPPHY